MQRNWLSLIHPDDVDATRISWRRALETGERHEITQRLRRADGVYRWFQTLAEPLRDREGRITQWYGLNIDIDDSRMAEAFRRTQARLSRATLIATVAELSASIAHEISQPLTLQIWSDHASLYRESSAMGMQPPKSSRASARSFILCYHDAMVPTLY